MEKTINSVLLNKITLFSKLVKIVLMPAPTWASTSCNKKIVLYPIFERIKHKKIFNKEKEPKIKKFLFTLLDLKKSLKNFLM